MCVRSIYGHLCVQPPKAGDIHASNAVFSGEVFIQSVFNGIPDSLKKVEAVLLKDNSGCKNCAFHQNHFERMECCVANKCVAYFRDTEQDDVYYKPLAEVSE